jgi:hypothetical protein
MSSLTKRIAHRRVGATWGLVVGVCRIVISNRPMYAEVQQFKNGFKNAN